MALDRSLELAGNVIAGPVCIGTAVVLGAGSGSGMLVAAVSALVGLILLVAIYVRGRRGLPALVPLFNRPFSFLQTRTRIWLLAHAARADTALQEVLAAHPRLVPTGLALSLVIEGLHLLELAALFAVFAIVVPFPLLLLSSIGIGMAHAVPVTAALGTLEATQIGLFTVGGEPLATGLAVAVAIRLAETLWTLVGLACLATAPGWRADDRRAW